MSITARHFVCCILLVLFLTALSTIGALGQATPLVPNSIQVLRMQYDGNNGNTYTSQYQFPEIFNDQAGCSTTNSICNVAGIQGSVWIDYFNSVPEAGTQNVSLPLPSTGTAVTTFPTPEPGSYITGSFSSKSEGALMLSVNGEYLTYFGYQGNDQLDDVSNSYSLQPYAELSPNTYTMDSSLGAPLNIISATESGTTATILVSGAPPAGANAYFTIAGMNAAFSGYNGLWVTKSVSSTTIVLTGLPGSLSPCGGVHPACGGTATWDQPYPFYDREVALIGANGLISLTPIDNADSGDNPRAAITVDGNELYTGGNSDSTTSTSTTSNNPGTTIGVRCAIPEQSQSYQLGTYFASDRTDESAKKHIKDNNWRGIGIYLDGNGNEQLYVSKGSGGNGDDGWFQVGSPLPSCTLGGTDTSNTITELYGAQATVPGGASYQTSPYLPFGFWMANPTTLYIADEGNPPTYTGGSSPSFQNSTNGTFTLPQLANGSFASDPYTGLEKWVLVNGTWTYAYTIQAGLNLYQPVTVPGGYNDINGDSIQSYTYGIRNMTGYNNGDGTATIYAITAQFSAVSGGEPDPTSLVGITDTISATSLPANEQFVTLETSGSGEVFRGVAYVPPASGFTRAQQSISFATIGNQTYGVGPITLSATATSGWPVYFTVTSGPATVSGNTLSITGAGQVTVNAIQTGNTDYAPETASQTFAVNPASQTISFTQLPPASEPYTGSFTVAATGGASGNAVTLTASGACGIINGGIYSAAYAMSSGSGTCSVIANQGGNSNYSAAPQVTYTVNATPLATSISVTNVSPAAEDYGLDSPVTITAVLSWTGNGAAPTAANVSIGGTGPSGYGATSCNPASGNTITCMATYTPTPADGAGTYTESAAFTGDANYSGSSSPQSNNFTIKQASTITAVGSSANPSAYGQSVTFTATVNTENGPKGRLPRKGSKKPQATGTVTWGSNTGCGTTNVTGDPGTATCITSSLAVGNDQVTATYSGDSNHTGSSGTSGVQVVSQASTTLNVTSVSPSNEDYGLDAPVTIMAVLSWTGNGAAPTATNVTIGGNGTSGYSATSCNPASGNTITCTATYTPTTSDTVGSYTETASFSGDTNYTASSSTQTNNFTINEATSSTTVGSSANPSSWGQSVTFTATISGENGPVKRTRSKAPQVTGSVTWSSNTGCGTTAVTAGIPGTATCTTSSLAIGNDPITATYSGDSNHSRSSASLSGGQVVNQASQTITFTTAPPASATYNTSFSVAATASSGLAVSFSSAGGCSNTGATYKMTSGTTACSVIASQAGNTNYAAVQDTVLVTATLASQTISFTTAPPSSARYATTFPVAATASTGLAVTLSSAGGCSNSGGTYTMTSGTTPCSVIATQAGNSNYAVVQSTKTVNALLESQSVSFTNAPPSSAPYGTSFTVSATASSGLPVTFTSAGGCSNSGGTYTITNGTTACSVIANQVGNSDYSAAQNTVTVTTSKINPTVTFTGLPTSLPYPNSYPVTATTNDTGNTATITSSSTTVCTVSGTTVTIVKGSGTCTVKASWAADSNYNAATLEQSGTAEKGIVTLSWTTPAAITYGTPLSSTQLDAVLTPSTVAGTIVYTPALGAYESAGTVTLNAAFHPTNTNYEAPTASVTLQVLQQATTTVITTSSESVTMNSSGVATATIDYTVGGYKPTGTVTLTASTGEVCSGTVSSSTGNGNCKLTFYTTGPRTIAAAYGGDANHTGSNNSGQSPVVVVTVYPH